MNRILVQVAFLVSTSALFVVLTMGAGKAIEEPKRDSRVAVNADQAAMEKLADCLWYSARNHGFYFIQRDVAMAVANVQLLSIWQGFVQTTGVEECGITPIDFTQLTQQLEQSLEDADRHFLSTM